MVNGKWKGQWSKVIKKDLYPATYILLPNTCYLIPATYILPPLADDGPESEVYPGAGDGPAWG